jgi:hypothetical protein
MSNIWIKNLLPSVKEAKAGDLKIATPKALKISFLNNCGEDIQATINELFKKKLPSLTLSNEGTPALFSIDKTKITEGDGEGYLLTIGKDGIEITANGRSGLYYGALTLTQILEDQNELCELTIKDWPSIKWRMFHMDLKTIPLDFEYIKYMIGELAEHKINSLVMEYEDKIQFKNIPGIHVDSAMSPEQIHELCEFCKSRCVEIVPLVQSYGHLEYILTKDRYKHLREDPMGLNETCGTNPEAKELIFSMMEEVIELHPNLKYFHIGGDEPFRVRFCEECRKIIDKEGKGALYLQHIKPIIEFIQAKGIIPIIWDDMLITHPEIADKLPKPLVVNYWNYMPTTDTSSNVLVRGVGELSLKNALKHPDRAKIDLYEKYWECDEFPEKAKTFPLVKYYQDIGYEVIGGGAARCSAQNPISINERAENMHYFSKRVSEANALGILATSWAASNSIAPPAEYWEYFWHPQLASAEYAWTGGETEIGDFDEIFLKNFYGIEDKIFTEFLTKTEANKVDCLPETIEHIEKINATKNKRNYRLFLEYLKRLSLTEQFHKILKNDFRNVSKYNEEAVLNIDLKTYANRGYEDKGDNLGWANEGDNNLAEFPRGKNIFGGIPFDIPEAGEENKAIICMNNKMDKDDLPKAIENIPVNAKCKTLNFIHSLSKNGVPPEALLGHYIAKYKDGSVHDIEIIMGKNINNWWKADSEYNTLTIWTGKNKVIEDSHRTVGISMTQWQNPFPEKEIESLTIQTEEKTSWLILAINAIKNIDSAENVSEDWTCLKKQIKEIEQNFEEAWQKEEKELGNVVNDELIAYYRKADYEPTIENIRSALII